MTAALSRPLVRRTAVVEPCIEGIDPIIARLYAARGVESPEQLDYSLNRLAPVGSLDGVDDAVALLLRFTEKTHRRRW